MPLPLLLLFSVRVDPADPDLVAGLQDLLRENAAAAAAPPQPAPAPPPPQREPAPAPWGRPRWAEGESSLPPPITSLRRRPALVRTRTGDGRLVIAHRGEGSVGRGGLVCTRRGEGEGEGHLTMHLL